jgi:dTMP kinase
VTSPSRGHLIAFEGGEGSGKSTQAARLATARGALLTREPGGTEVGRRIRDIVLDPGVATLADRAEALLVAADRAQHVAEVIEPALAAGRDVITDRFAGSTLAYQGYGRGLPLDELETLSRWATGGLAADLVVLLAVPPEVARARMQRDLDRVEQAGDGFHDRVVGGFVALAADQPHRWVVVDGEGTEDEVAQRVLDAVATRLHP